MSRFHDFQNFKIFKISIFSRFQDFKVSRILMGTGSGPGPRRGPGPDGLDPLLRAQGFPHRPLGGGMGAEAENIKAASLGPEGPEA